MNAPQRGRFHGRVALITGAAGAGIGTAIANRLASEGAAIVAVDHHERRTADAVKRLQANYDVGVAGYAIDVADRPAVDEMLVDATKALGDIDIVINSAAINVQGSIFDYDPSDFDHVLAVDLTACWYLIRQTIGTMRRIGRGSIVNIGSVAAYNGGRGREAPYSTSKAALHELTRSVAIEGGPYGIRCNAIAPGLIWSKFVEKHKARFEVEAEATPLRRHGQPEEIANVAAFLVSEESSYITGEVINVSGGWFLSP